MADTVSALVDNQRRELPEEIAEGNLGSDACRVSNVTQIISDDFDSGVKRLTDSREILLFTMLPCYMLGSKADVRQPNRVHATPDSNAADCHSVPFALAPEKAVYDGDGLEKQRAASPQALAVGH